MSKTLPLRLLVWLALLFGALGGMARPSAALTRAADAPAMMATTLHHGWCSGHVSAEVPDGHRSPTWHRGTGRRTQRGPCPLLAVLLSAGSIPVTGPLYSQRAGWPAVGEAACHVTGRLAAPPRAPPTQN